MYKFMRIKLTSSDTEANIVQLAAACAVIHAELGYLPNKVLVRDPDFAIKVSSIPVEIEGVITQIPVEFALHLAGPASHLPEGSVELDISDPNSIYE